MVAWRVRLRTLGIFGLWELSLLEALASKHATGRTRDENLERLKASGWGAVPAAPVIRRVLFQLGRDFVAKISW